MVYSKKKLWLLLMQYLVLVYMLRKFVNYVFVTAFPWAKIDFTLQRSIQGNKHHKLNYENFPSSECTLYVLLVESITSKITGKHSAD